MKPGKPGQKPVPRTPHILRERTAHRYHRPQPAEEAGNGHSSIIDGHRAPRLDLLNALDAGLTSMNKAVALGEPVGLIGNPSKVDSAKFEGS
jgi:hypothetical protein